MCDCAICVLTITPFSRLQVEEKLYIVNNGRPTPILNIKKNKNGKGMYSFQSHWYEQNSWLCGCQNVNKMYCWPCILFSTKNVDRAWCANGVNDILNFSILRKRHIMSKEHVACLTKFIMFGKSRIETNLSEAYKISIQKHNDKVRNNRYIISRLIDAVCYLARQEQVFQGHDESETSVNRGNYMELLNLIAKSDSLLAQHLNSITTGGVLLGTSPDIQNDLINAIYRVLMDEIKREVDSACYVSVVLEETTDISHKTQLYTVLRYVTDEVQERFLGFEDCSADRSAYGFYSHLEKILTNYNCGSKLVCQTYDGASVMAGCHNGLQKLVRDKYPSAIFVHCYAHKLDLVLQQSASSITSCRTFFQTCKGLSDFFSKSSIRANAFETIVKRKFPTIAPTRWVYSSTLIEVLYETMESLMELFEDMSVDSSWDHETKIMALGYYQTMNRLEFQFFLLVFSEILPKAEVLYNILQKDICDIQMCREKIDLFLNQLLNLRDSFDLIWKNVSPFERHSKKRIRTNDTEEASYRALFFEIMDNLIVNIKDRFGNISELRFLTLLQPSMFSEHNKRFPMNSFNCLKGLYPNFDAPKLKTELEVIYSDEAYLAFNSVAKFYAFMRHTGLFEALPETFKLATLILTIPATSPSEESSFSALNRIHTFLRNSQAQEGKCNLGILSIEKNLLDRMSQDHGFYDMVIAAFIKQKPRQIELLYK